VFFVLKAAAAFLQLSPAIPRFRASIPFIQPRQS
jgi:hypothetical protein